MDPGVAASVRSPAAATEAPGVAAGSWPSAALTKECVATAGRLACAANGCSRTPALGLTGRAATGAALTALVRPRLAVAGRVNLAGPAAGGRTAPGTASSARTPPAAATEASARNMSEGSWLSATAASVGGAGSAFCPSAVTVSSVAVSFATHAASPLAATSPSTAPLDELLRNGRDTKAKAPLARSRGDMRRRVTPSRSSRPPSIKLSTYFSNKGVSI